jgi:hypothetical protein
MDDSTIDQKNVNLSNIFYDTFAEVVNYYKDTDMEVWEETCTIALSNTAAEVGLFDKSDIIAVYDLESHLPVIITERIYRENYTWNEWRKMKRYMRNKTSCIKQELGFNIRISYSKGYIDYVHYKEEWWQWALKHQQQQEA